MAAGRCLPPYNDSWWEAYNPREAALKVVGESYAAGDARRAPPTHSPSRHDFMQQLDEMFSIKAREGLNSYSVSPTDSSSSVEEVPPLYSSLPPWYQTVDPRLSLTLNSVASIGTISASAQPSNGVEQALAGLTIVGSSQVSIMYVSEGNNPLEAESHRPREPRDEDADFPPPRQQQRATTHDPSSNEEDSTTKRRRRTIREGKWRVASVQESEVADDVPVGGFPPFEFTSSIDTSTRQPYQ